MKLSDLHKPSIPVAYGLLILEAAESCGLARSELLAGSVIPAETLETPDARLSMAQCGVLLFRAAQRMPALGYEIGLHSSLTSHGFIGYGVMSHRTLRDAIAFGSKFLQLRLPNLSIRLVVDGVQAAVEVTETIALGKVRRCMFDLFLVGIARIGEQVMGRDAGQMMELWYDYAEPPYYAAYRRRLPRVHFGMGANQLRFPAALLDRPLRTGNPVTAKLVSEQCERELSVLGFSGDFLTRVRSLLDSPNARYPALEAAAKRLHLSARTLKRKLQQEGTSYQQLLDAARRRDSIRLLGDPTLAVENIALQIGYSDPANFTRAFRKWTGATPSEYRKRLTSAARPASREPAPRPSAAPTRSLSR